MLVSTGRDESENRGVGKVDTLSLLQKREAGTQELYIFLYLDEHA